MGIKINFFCGQGARGINAEVLNAQKLQCWGSDKDTIFAPTILTLLLLWCYPSLSTQTFRRKPDSKATTLSALRNPPFPKWLSCIAHWNYFPFQKSVLIPFPHLPFAQSSVLLFSDSWWAWHIQEHFAYMFVGVYVYIFIYAYIIYIHIHVYIFKQCYCLEKTDKQPEHNFSHF